MSDEPITSADVDRIWKMMKEINICMLVTVHRDQINARPMATTVRPEHNDIIMLTEKTSGKDRELAESPHAVLNFSNGATEFVALRGIATRNDDRALIKEMWNPGAQVFWPKGPGDPNIEAIIVRPVEAEYWASSSSLLNSVKMAFAMVTGQKPDLGENEKVAL
ncbi:MAG: pyridoxamine 5'-phosphate oxidase family protein [Aestuariivirga sp.]